MKLHTDVGATTTWELSPRDLRDARRLRRVATRAAIGDRVYAPLEFADRTGPERSKLAMPLDAEGCEPVKPTKPDPHRVDALRVALRERGRELVDELCFYWRVVPR